MVPEWCVIETLVFVGLNLSMVSIMIRRHFMVVTRDYSLDMSFNQLELLRQKIVDHINIYVEFAEEYYVNRERKLKINGVLTVKVFI